VNAPLYTKEILRLAADLPDPRQLEREDGLADLRSSTCGSRVKVAVQLDPQGKVQEVALSVQACAFGQASSALMAKNAAGRSREEVMQAFTELTGWLDGARDDPGRWPGLEALAPARPRKGRHGAILLPFRALLAAMEGSAK
jgi:NifU-like protein involved in Fe-S cluster formation